MNRLLNIFFVLTLIFSNSVVNAQQVITIPVQEGSIEMKELLNSCKKIASSTSSKYVNKSIPGSIIEIKSQKYEVRFFSFEDTTGKLEENRAFKEYLEQNNLLTLKSIITIPQTGIIFQSFSSRSTTLDDGVYFGIGLRLME